MTKHALFLNKKNILRKYMYQQSSSCNRSLYKISVLIFVEKQRLIIMTAVTVEFNMACILEDGEEGGGVNEWTRHFGN